jgi:filamentous hemagglutinin family protein
MREKMKTNSASRISLRALASLVIGALLFSTFNITRTEAAPPTEISPSQGAGGLRTLVSPSSAPSSVCTANCVITGGTRPGSGTNLFHSFTQFNIGTGDITTFQNGISFDINGNPLSAGLPTSNILARVTGGNISSIYGTIQTSGFGSANLFLMNPTGFLFGPNATVNVGGMVAFTSGDYLRLGEINGNSAGIFHADPAQTSVLTSAPVTAFGFIGSNPAAINFEGGQFTVAEGAGLALVGGNISLVADASGTPSSITAPGRRIQMTSAAGPGEIAADTGMSTAGMSMGTITLDQGTILDTSYNSGAPVIGDGSGGLISIRAGQLLATGTTITTSPAAGTFAAGGAVTVDVTGGATFTDSAILTSPVFDFSFTGSAGAVAITANQNLTMTRTTIDTSASFAGGDAGSVTLNSLMGTVSLTDSTIRTFGSAPGNGGAVTINGHDVLFKRSSVDTSVDVGLFGPTPDDLSLGLVRPGAVTVTAEDTVTFSDSPSNEFEVIPVIKATAIGTLLDAGPVTITGNTVNLSNGMIQTSMFRYTEIPSPGDGGTIEIRGNNVNLSHFTLESDNGGFLASTGRAGNILLRGADQFLAENIQLTNSFLNTTSVTGGGAGNIEFQTNTLTLSDTLVRANTFSVGPGGSITVHGAQTVTLHSNSLMDTSAIVSGVSEGPFGTAGSILFETQQLMMDTGSRLRAADLPTSQGDAGSIRVQGTNGPAQSILIDGTGTGILTDAEGNGAGGNINLFTNIMTIQNGGTVSAITSGTVPTATGGSILVNANTVTLNTGGTLTAASTGAGSAGDIIVQGLASPANSVLIDGSGSGIFTNTSGTGSGGSIFVEGNAVTLQNEAHVSSSSTGTGVAGDIAITAGNQFAMTNSSVTTEATQSGGGAIKITTAPSGTVQLTNSQISASVLDGTGGGGSVDIDPQFVILQNSQITANAVNGPGGNIFITTNLLLPDSTSVISASSQFGQQGTITIQSPVSPGSGKLNPISQRPLITAAMVNQRCAALAGGSISSFTVAGRDSLPAEPGGWLSSPLAFATPSVGAALEAKGEGSSGSSSLSGSSGLSSSSGSPGSLNQRNETNQMNETNEIPLLSLRQIGPTGFLTQVFAVEPSGCQS